jgi:hypothetical protein
MKKIIGMLFMLLALTLVYTGCSKDDDKDVQYATISGTVVNSQTGFGLPNATLKFCTGTAKSTNSLSTEFTVLTDEYGNFYSETAHVGTFTLVIEADGFYNQIIYNVVITIDIINYLPTYTIVADLGTSALRIVLTWGDSPSDLDSHLTGPSSTTSDRFHCYFSNKTPDSEVILDVDDVSSYGPETTTIYDLINGTYRYSIYNYSSSGIDGCLGIYSSPAMVQIYDQSGLIRSYTAPTALAGEGNTWVVFEINSNGSTYTITDVNDYVYSSGSGYVEKK